MLKRASTKEKAANLPHDKPLRQHQQHLKDMQMHFLEKSRISCQSTRSFVTPFRLKYCCLNAFSQKYVISFLRGDMLNYPSEYIDFLVHFHGDRDYFECHEVLEDYWKKVDKNNKQSIWVSLILLAVGNYHYRRNNRNGAKRTLMKALSRFLLHQKKRQIATLGINDQHLISILKNQLKNINEGIAYKSILLPLTDESLINECKKRSENKGYIWGSDSQMNNTQLIHRHSLRNRSEIIKARQVQLIKKKRRFN